MGHWTPWIKLHHITEILHLPRPELLRLHVGGVCVFVCQRARCVFTRGVVSGLTVPSQYTVCVGSLSGGVGIDRCPAGRIL